MTAGIELERILKRPAPELVDWACRAFGPRFAIVTALQPEGTVLIDMAVRQGCSPRVVTIDTGRLPAETHQMIETVRTQFGLEVEVLRPQPDEVDRMVARHGSDLFLRDPALRRLCCHIRKVRPMEQFRATVDAWATGLRRSQSDERADVETAAREPDGRLKLNPLAAWTHDEVMDYVRRHHVPLHPLLERGYATIGCAPCTRAIAPGEDARAGRWWWEAEGGKECGLHTAPDGRLRRALDVLIEEILH